MFIFVNFYKKTRRKKIVFMFCQFKEENEKKKFGCFFFTNSKEENETKETVLFFNSTKKTICIFFTNSKKKILKMKCPLHFANLEKKKKKENLSSTP